MRIAVDTGTLPGVNGDPLGGRYHLVEPIGTGGMAVVWRAYDGVLARMVAIKLLNAGQTGDPGARDRIRQEARAAAALSHPNIAQVHDYGEWRTQGQVVPYVVMELVPGGTLLQRLSAAPVTPRFAMRLCAEIAAALAAAHAEGLVHRDIKPANIMLAPTGAKVVDFGIAAATAPAGAGDLDAEVLGTPAYLAPERLIGDAVQPASDVYALGVVLYRLLSGHSPWTDDDTTQMLASHIYVEPTPLPPLPGVPEHVRELCMRCLAKDPALRPSARETAALLAGGAGMRVVEDEQPYAATAATATDPEPSVLIRPARAAGRRPPARALVAAAALLVAAGGVGWWLLPGDPEAADAQDAPAVVVPPALIPASSAAAPAPAPASPATRTAGGTARPATAGAPTTAAAAAPEPTATVPGPTTATPTPGAPTPRAPQTTRTTTPPEPEPAPQERTLSSVAGTVRATCPSPGTAEILDWTALRPYKVQSAERGPAARPAVVYKHGNTQVTMTVTCSGGRPSADVDGA